MVTIPEGFSVALLIADYSALAVVVVGFAVILCAGRLVFLSMGLK